MEYIGPCDDETLDFNKVAVVAAQATTANMLAHYDAKNPDAMFRLVASGVQISVFPPDVIETRGNRLDAVHDVPIYAAAQEHCAGLISSNAAFAKICAAQRDFRGKNYLYHRSADYQYDTIMLMLRRKP